MEASRSSPAWGPADRAAGRPVAGADNRTSSISLSVAAGTVDGLGLLKGGSPVKAVVVVDEAYEGWALADEVLRMATKSAPVQETIPTGLFAKQNIGTIQVTAAAQASGTWFGGTSFENEFAKLWGVGQ